MGQIINLNIFDRPQKDLHFESDSGLSIFVSKTKLFLKKWFSPRMRLVKILKRVRVLSAHPRLILRIVHVTFIEEAS